MIDINMQGPRALVTGATGFIGSNLVKRLLQEGWGVDIITRADSNLEILSPVCDKLTIRVHDGSTRGLVELVGEARPDVVFHLASCFLAQHKPEDIEILVTSNLLFSTQLVEAMVAHGIYRLLNTGTSWQHYHNADYLPVNLYAATKQAFEDILSYYVDAHELRVTSLALFDTYGPGDTRQKLMSLLWKTALGGETLSMSPGKQLIDIVYIDDIVDAFLIAADQLFIQPGGHLRYGLSSGHPMPLVELAKAFENATGHSLSIKWGAREYRPREVMVPWTAFETLPGWKPSVSFEEGILRTRTSYNSRK